jgi:carbon storage regulator
VSPVGRKQAAITPWIRNGTMLVLSRKKDEKIVIGDNISIMIVEIRGDKVRLGIDAPRDVSVHRREVYDAIKRKESEQDSVEDDSTGLSTNQVQA